MPTPSPRGSLLNAPEYADRVNLIKKIKVGATWRFAPVVPEPNGRLKDKVRINGAVETHTEGAYYIEWRERGKRCRVSVAREDAVAEARKKAVELQAIRDGLIASPEPVVEEAVVQTPIGDAIDAYLRYVKMQRKSRTFLTYRYTLDVLLRASYKKKYVEDATRQDAIDFMTYCYEQGLGSRTVYDKVVTVLQLFKKHGRSGLMEKGDWPKYVDAIRPCTNPKNSPPCSASQPKTNRTCSSSSLVPGCVTRNIGRLNMWTSTSATTSPASPQSRSGTLLRKTGKSGSCPFPTD